MHASDAVLIGLGPELRVDHSLAGQLESRLDTLISIGVSTWLGLSF